jgi:predicted ABC-type ATPase
VPCIYVLAGTNGAGKSSIGGAMLRATGVDYFNPDEVARELRASNPHLTAEEANAEAWNQSRALLQRTIAEHLTFAFETTLGGMTIAALLEKALDAGIEVRIWYAGLSSPEHHIARVKARVAKGGHPIPDEKIIQRYDGGRRNLIRLLPRLTELYLYDNSAEADPTTGATPTPIRLLHMQNGKVVSSSELHLIPEWAKPIVVVALGQP